MNERKPIKISLSTFFLIVAMIVIVVMGYFMYQFYTDKIKAEEKVENLNSEVTKLEGTVNNLQGKIDLIANTVNTNNSNKNQTDLNKEISESDVKKLAEMHLKTITTGSGERTVEVWGFEGLREEIISRSQEDSNEITVKTNIKYDEFKNKVLEYYSKEYFDSRYGSIENREGYVTYSCHEGGDAGGETRIINVTKISDGKYSVEYEYKTAGTEWPGIKSKMNINLIEQDDKFVINSVDYIEGINAHN